MHTSTAPKSYETLSPERVRVPPATPPGGRTVAVLAASGLALGIWGMRWVAFEPGFGFLPWNLMLAWIPLGAAWAAVRPGRSRGAALALGALWLAFLPNAPYLVTDLAHLRDRPPVPHMLDVLLFASFALAGCATGWASLALVHARLAAALGRARAAAAVGAVLLLTGFGVYLGRFERWNSWDLVARPHAVLADAALALGRPKALAFTVLFAAFVGVGYALVAPAPRERGRTRA